MGKGETGRSILPKNFNRKITTNIKIMKIKTTIKSIALASL
jgi:hypothetical protein